MFSWHERQLPYPVLLPWNDDYGDRRYVASVPTAVLGDGSELRLAIKHHCTSEYLCELIADGRATYCSLVVCSRTSTREAWESSEEDDLQVVDASQYAEELMLYPYIVAKDSIRDFKSDEHAPEFSRYRPNGFVVEPASILAVGDAHKIVIDAGGSPHSVIDLVATPSVDHGMFEVNLDEERIKIHLRSEDKARMESLRAAGLTSAEMRMLFSSVYLHAVAEALRNISAHPDVRWARTLRNSLERHEVAVDDELLKSDALKYAQIIMDKPVGDTLRAFVEGRDE